LLHTFVGISGSEGTVIGNLPDTFSLGSSIAGVADTLHVGVQRLSAQTETFFGSVNVQELW